MAKIPKVVFLGTPEIVIPTLKYLSQELGPNLLLTVSQPSRPVGRGQKIAPPAAAQYCIDHELPYSQTENINIDEELYLKLSHLKPDILLVFAFGQFLGNKILTLPSQGCFNIHASLLPKYRGAAPIQYALLNGEKLTGLSIQKMVKKMDAGDICIDIPITIDDVDTAHSLSEKVSFAAIEATHLFLDGIKNNSLKFRTQNELEVSFAPSIQKEAGHLFFSTNSAHECINKIRAFYPWPGTFCVLNGKRLKILRAEVVSYPLAPGNSKVVDKKLYVGCKEGCLRLTEVQLEGKKVCSDIELTNGIRSEIEFS